MRTEFYSDCHKIEKVINSLRFVNIFVLFCLAYIIKLGKPQKKYLFLVARQVRPNHPPPPIELSDYIFGDFLSFIKSSFFLVARPLPQSPSQWPGN